MKKEIIEGGYLTHALTNGDSKIYGVVKDHSISDWSHEGALYWSEVYVYGNSCHIIRRGTLLVGKTNEELSELHEQSKANLND